MGTAVNMNGHNFKIAGDEMTTFEDFLNEEQGPFHVYHKIKGDRMGGPDYYHVKEHPTREEAEAHAHELNGGVKRPKGFHSHVVKRHSFFKKNED